jgi:uncharacterized cupin superfamily protein
MIPQEVESTGGKRGVMADLGGGVYVSRVDADEFEPDEEDGGLVQMLFEDGVAMAGLWKPDPAVSGAYTSPVLSARETIVVLAGSARVEVENGPMLDLSVGDIASIPKGAVTTWHPSPDFKKVWVYS